MKSTKNYKQFINKLKRSRIKIIMNLNRNLIPCNLNVINFKIKTRNSIKRARNMIMMRSSFKSSRRNYKFRLSKFKTNFKNKFNSLNKSYRNRILFTKKKSYLFKSNNHNNISSLILFNKNLTSKRKITLTKIKEKTNLSQQF